MVDNKYKKIVGRDELVVEWGNGNDGLTEMSVKVEIRGRERIITMKDVIYQVNCELL